MNEITNSIQGLSVTTTMEVGVDIGSLQLVLMANMPPQDLIINKELGEQAEKVKFFHMLQLYVEGGSHDEYYYYNSKKITGDNPIHTSLLRFISTKRNS